MRKLLLARWTLIALVVTAWLGTAPASAVETTTITFDTNAAGAPLSAPCAFDRTAPLTELYAALGVHFSGPGEQLGGAVLNQCGGFSVPARSGTNFLAFARAVYGRDPETIRFDVPQRTVTIFGGSGYAGTFTMVAYRGSAQVAIATTTPGVGAYGELSVTSGQGIDRVVLTATFSTPAFVFDDLSFLAAVPESKNDCKNGGWRNYSGFKNQGDCVSFVATRGKNAPAS